MNAVFTIGFSGKTMPKIAQLLMDNGVAQVIDVRWRAGSQHRPDAAKTNLRASLHRAGIEYIHVPTLGSPPEIRKALHSTGDYPAFEAQYGSHVAGRQDDLKRLVSMATDRTSVLFCTEADWRACHRKVLVGLLEGLGFEVVHL